MKIPEGRTLPAGEARYSSQEPTCLNEIAIEELQLTYSENNLPLDHKHYRERLAKDYKKDVQRLVCRRIIKEKKKQKGYIDDLNNWLRNEYVILILTKDNNITDAMIEEERKRCNTEKGN